MQGSQNCPRGIIDWQLPTWAWYKKDIEMHPEDSNRGPPWEQPRASWGREPPGGVQSFGTVSSQSSDAGSQTKQPARRGRWTWSSSDRDYVQDRGGEILKYTEYQLGAANATVQGTSSGAEQVAIDGEGQPEQPADLSLGVDEPLAQVSLGEHPARIPRPYETPLDPRFRVVEKPKRFFTVGRIFKTVWFEPGTQQEGTTANPDVDWSAACPFYHEEKPFAKFRWFVVVRKRLHHSLCFAITTFGGKGATKASRGRARDFVVLYPGVIEPPEPWPEEKIERDPLAVIIEEAQQFLSPAARVDCGRIYTVEDNLRVMRIGRIDPLSLIDLEAYYKESVS